jgi:hypothetical protein
MEIMLGIPTQMAKLIFKFELSICTLLHVPTSTTPGFFFILVCEAIGTAATPGLLCQPRVIVNMMIVGKQMECRLAGETEVLGENLPQSHFCPSQNPTWPDPDLNPGRRGGKPATNRLSYGAANTQVNIILPFVSKFVSFIYVFRSSFVRILSVRSTSLAHLIVFDIIVLSAFYKTHELLNLTFPKYNIKVKKPALIFLIVGPTCMPLLCK